MKKLFHKQLTVTQQNIRRISISTIFAIFFILSLILGIENHWAFILSVMFALLQICSLSKNETLSETFLNIAIISALIILRFFDFFIKANLMNIFNFWAFFFCLSFTFALIIRFNGNIEMRPYISKLEKIKIQSSREKINICPIYTTCLSATKNTAFKENFYSLKNKKKKNIIDHLKFFLMKQELCDISDAFFSDNVGILRITDFYKIQTFIVRKIN